MCRFFIFKQGYEVEGGAGEREDWKGEYWRLDKKHISTGDEGVRGILIGFVWQSHCNTANK